jgi:drug/metabolite transporter (DMT)-like permease
MEKSKKLNLIGIALLFGATLAWGTSFFILKETISEVPRFFVITIRFLLASGGLALIFINKMKGMTKKTFVRGVILGTLLTLAYVTQTIGLENTTPGRNAFLTSSYCVMCPFLLWILFSKKPKLYHVVSAVLCIVGIGMVALSGTDGVATNVLLGDGLTLVSAIFFGLQIVYIDKFQKEGHDAIRLLVPELLTAGVLHLILTLVFELPLGIENYALTMEQALKIGYLTIACTLFAQFAQIIGQKFTSANQSAIILSLEAVFGVLFSVLFANEQLTALIVCGFVIIFVAIMISELKLDPIKIFCRKKNNSKGVASDNSSSNYDATVSDEK